MNITRDQMDQNEIAALGASLRRIEQKLLGPARVNGTQRVWYQGGEPYFDVFLELREGEIEWFQFTLRGKSLSWNKKQSGWQTGDTNELKVDDITFYPASKLIRNDNQTDYDFMEVAHSILKTRAGEEILDQVLALF